MRLTLAFLLSIALLVAAPTTVRPQQDTAAASETAAEPGPAALPDPVEITVRLRTVADSAAHAERQIARLADTEALAAELDLARQRQEELQQLVVGLGEAESVRAGRIAQVRTRALAEEARLESLDERASERLRELGRLRTEWTERQRFWLRWRAELRDDPEFALFEPEMEQAVGQAEAVRQRVASEIPDVVAVQREIQSLRLETGRIAELASTMLAGRRAALLQRDQPPIFSTALLGQLRQAPLAEWNPFAAASSTAYGDFIRENLLLLILHVLLVVFLARIARYLRRRASLATGWSEALKHPWADAIFVSTALLAQQYAQGPALIEVLVWAALAGAGAVLASRLVASRPLRWMVYCFAAFYPLFLLAEAIRLPAPLFQLGLAGVAALGLVFFLGLMRRSARLEGEPGLARGVLGFGAAMWAAVLVAELVGYHRLALWVIHAAVTSALIVFVVGFLVVVARGLLWTLVNIQMEGRLRVLHTVGVPIVERLLRLVQVVLVIGALLTLLNVWELTASPLETWSAITRLGFTVAGVSITIGRVLLAIVLVYLTALGSRVVRTFVTSELVPRWEMDRGVGDSISSVVHYLAIAIGVLFALGALGVELQSIALVAGALSLGIGFGLQNVVNNFVSGVILLFERPVRVGDTVVVGGEWGTITKIGLRSTIIETFARSEIIVPNGDLVSEKVTNWTLTNAIARLELPVGVAHGSPVGRVLQVLREAGAAHPAVLDDPEPQPLFVAFGERALEFELRVWVRELRHRLEVQSVILEEIDRRFRQEGIAIPFPQRDLHLRSLHPDLLEALRRRDEERGEGT